MPTIYAKAAKTVSWESFAWRMAFPYVVNKVVVEEGKEIELIGQGDYCRTLEEAQKKADDYNAGRLTWAW